MADTGITFRAPGDPLTPTLSPILGEREQLAPAFSLSRWREREGPIADAMGG
jgi:hypothetical protein